MDFCNRSGSVVYRPFGHFDPYISFLEYSFLAAQKRIYYAILPTCFKLFVFCKHLLTN